MNLPIIWLNLLATWEEFTDILNQFGNISDEFTGNDIL